MAFAATASKRGARADMDKPAINVAKELARLSALTIFELRGEWRRLHRTPPMRLSRDLLTRGIRLQLQERGGAAAASSDAADAALARPLDPRDHLQASGAGVRRPFPGHRTEAGARQCRSAEPRRGQTRTADLLEARHAARAGVARGHPYGPHPCRWRRVARPAVPLPHYSRAKDYGRPLVGPAVFWPQAAAAGLLLKRERGPWPGLVTRA